MSRLPRKFVFEPHEVGVYHSINRCVRWSMLCGWDLFTQRSYKHRKVWLQQRLMFLASVMALDIKGFCTMANHLHLIVRNRPDVVANWSPEQIARKWLQLFRPISRGGGKWPRRPPRPTWTRSSTILSGWNSCGCGSRTRPG